MSSSRKDRPQWIKLISHSTPCLRVKWIGFDRLGNRSRAALPINRLDFRRYIDLRGLTSDIRGKNEDSFHLNRSIDMRHQVGGTLRCQARYRCLRRRSDLEEVVMTTLSSVICLLSGISWLSARGSSGITGPQMVRSSEIFSASVLDWQANVVSTL
ncbi:hypothetical protein BO71DRAFT_433380 [Aspergillus ellipticus CBS 707.79]|uniref:Uncharacterized protein n=1 Tax=Aspergillus ellipticus CBS 707.79 TaxID=1448320 RepID=A0A319D1I2_9EURO|nr:hypothetical protein BO71DRAFT_433380 [Aspergillus ellipticus CBS 707.79]